MAAVRVTHAGAYEETERKSVQTTHAGMYVEIEIKYLRTTHAGAYLEIEATTPPATTRRYGPRIQAV